MENVISNKKSTNKNNLDFYNKKSVSTDEINKVYKKNSFNDDINSIFFNQGRVINFSPTDPRIHSGYFHFSNFSIDETHKLGKGAFGSVFVAMNKLDARKFAAKVVNLGNKESDEEAEKAAKNEIKIMGKINHPNIIRLYSFHQSPSSLIIFLEIAKGGSLFRLIRTKGNLTEIEAVKIFTQVASALAFLHSHGLVHRDIKPENVLLDEKGNAKLCDFGWCASVEQGQRHTFCGTYEYMAPEVVKDEPYSSSVDDWALGVLLFEMLHGHSPFRAAKGEAKKGQEYKPVFSKILKGKPENPREDISEECKDIMKKLMEPEPSKRMKVKDIFEHNWVKGFEEREKEKRKNMNNNSEGKENTKITDKNQKQYDTKDNNKNMIDDNIKFIDNNFDKFSNDSINDDNCDILSNNAYNKYEIMKDKEYIDNIEFNKKQKKHKKNISNLINDDNIENLETPKFLGIENIKNSNKMNSNNNNLSNNTNSGSLTKMNNQNYIESQENEINNKNSFNNLSNMQNYYDETKKKRKKRKIDSKNNKNLMNIIDNIKNDDNFYDFNGNIDDNHNDINEEYNDKNFMKEYDIINTDKKPDEELTINEVLDKYVNVNINNNIYNNYNNGNIKNNLKRTNKYKIKAKLRMPDVIYNKNEYNNDDNKKLDEKFGANEISPIVDKHINKIDFKLKSGINLFKSPKKPTKNLNISEYNNYAMEDEIFKKLIKQNLPKTKKHKKNKTNISVSAIQYENGNNEHYCMDDYLNIDFITPINKLENKNNIGSNSKSNHKFNKNISASDIDATFKIIDEAKKINDGNHADKKSKKELSFWEKLFKPFKCGE